VTVMAWVRGSGYSGPNAYIVSKGAEECFGASYALYTGDSGGLVFYVTDGVTLNFSPDAGFSLWNGDWHLVAGTYDGHMVRLYVDGVEVGEGTEATIGGINYNLGDNGRFYIGAYRGTCDLGFTGDVDEVQVFSRALTAAELENIYSAGSGDVSVAGAAP
jgi:beta-galactosidase